MVFNYRNFIYNEERGFIFVYVPKVACTNWKALLRQMLGYEDWLDPVLAHDRQRSGLRFLDATGPEKALLLDPGIKKFTMVRNPYSRLLSAYLNKIEERQSNLDNRTAPDFFDEIGQAIERYRKDALDSALYPTITFEVFLRWILNREKYTPPVLYMRANEHWAKQVDLLLWPEIKFDIIGKFENLKEDSDKILAAMGSSANFPSQKDIKFVPTSASTKIQQYLSPATIGLINEWFESDFMALGYSNQHPMQ